MYQMSQPQYHIGQNFSQSRLEHIANANIPENSARIAYSIAIPLSQNKYSFSAFSFSSAAKTYHSELFSNYALQQRNFGQYFSSPSHREYHFQPEQFLKPEKAGKFVGKAEEIREFVVEAFEKMLHCPFPQDIKISVCEESAFRKLAPHPDTIGLSINRRKQGLLSEIFVLAGSLGRVLLTVGHELGHVFTGTLHHAQNEEAKAYAFSMAWMEVIKEHNIAGLSTAFVEEYPAHNGLHDVAFGFVSKLLKQGEKAERVWEGLVSGELSVAM